MARTKQPPAFLLGAPRSGTSLLYKALCLHPDTAWVSNWVRRWPGRPQFALLNRAAGALPTRRRDVWFGGESGNAYVYGRHRQLQERIFPMPVEGEPVFSFCGVPPHAGPGAPTPDRDAPARLRVAFDGIRRASGGKVFVNKRIANNQRIGLLREAFPDARFVEITRDGRAVALSLSLVDWWEDSLVWWYGGTPKKWAVEGGDPWELCAREWVEDLASLDAGLADVPDEQVLRLRYEDFVADPLPTLHVVARFCGLGPSRSWDTALSALRFPNQNEAWREKLGPAAIATIEGVQRLDLVRHGYDVDGREMETP